MSLLMTSHKKRKKPAEKMKPAESVGFKNVPSQVVQQDNELGKGRQSSSSFQMD
jgi:hypothetical protein